MNNHVVTTNPVRIGYPYLLKPRMNDDGTAGKYGAMLIIPKTDTATVNALNAAIDSARKMAVAEGNKAAANYRSPLKDGDGVKQNGEEYGPECKGCWVLNVSSKNKPGLCDRNLQAILDPAEIYPGMWANVDILFKAFKVQSNAGITCYLNNLQKVRDDTPLGGAPERPENVFTAVAADDDFGL